MTHGELLEKISFKKNKSFYLREALRAVVELHSPVFCNNTDNNTAINECRICKEEPYYSCNASYPCPTIQAIEKELQ